LRLAQRARPAPILVKLTPNMSKRFAIKDANGWPNRHPGLENNEAGGCRHEHAIDPTWMSVSSKDLIIQSWYSIPGRSPSREAECPAVTCRKPPCFHPGFPSIDLVAKNRHWNGAPAYRCNQIRAKLVTAARRLRSAAPPVRPRPENKCENQFTDDELITFHAASHCRRRWEWQSTIGAR
jgi:hypothetical protein